MEPLGVAVAASLLLGVLVVQRFPTLPPPALSCLLVLLGAAGWIALGAWRWLGAALLGVGLACLHGQAALSAQMPARLAGVALALEARVVGLPVHGPDGVRMQVEILGGEALASPLSGRRVRLAWYARGDATAPQIAAGSRWSMVVKLRPPRGLANPGGYDAERRALEQRIAATGYVLSGAPAVTSQGGFGLDALRGRLSGQISAAVPGERGRFVAALALGDTRGLSDRDWEILRITGLTHLIAISGFHVGLVAGFGALLGRGAYWMAPGLGRRLPLPLGSAVSALVFAAVYTALAGFALPTLRTLLMIAAVVVARLGRRRPSLPESLSFALVAVLLMDPLSVLAPGFWLSFMGVAWLVWCLPDSAGQWLKPFLHAQAVAMLGLLPLSVWFFSQASLVGPAVNLVGIPWISLVVVPLALLGLAAAPVWPGLADALWNLSANLMHWLWLGLAWVANWPAALVWLPEPSLAAVLLSLLGVFWLMLPRPVPGKPLAALLLLPLLWPALPRPEQGEARLLLLDVGQGLSLLVQTRRHTLLYDAGPALPGGMDLGESVVVPALRARGLSRLDALVISHGDNDHAGGAAAVLRAMPTERVLAPSGWARPGMDACVAGQDWQWDGVRFRILHPTPHFPYLRNDSSCVLRIDTAGASALLPGDIGRHVEARLSKLPGEQVAADLIVLPHHGSDTSSSLDFIAAVRPSWGLVAAGHDNRFSLPKPVVLARYERYGVRLLDTANGGATEFELGQAGVRLVRRSRADAPRYWRDAAHVGSGYANGGPEPDR